MRYIANAFSLQMLGAMAHPYIEVEQIPELSKEDKAACMSVVGHLDTARVLGVEFNRASLTIQKGDVLFVAQLVGGRLPEGATTLPKGAHFVWYKMTFR